MKSIRRSRNMLIELLIVIIFLGIASGIITELFAASYHISLKSRRTQTAMLLARDALERFTAGQSLPEAYNHESGGDVYHIRIEVHSDATGSGAIECCTAEVSVNENVYAKMETACYLQGGGADGA